MYLYKFIAPPVHLLVMNCLNSHAGCHILDRNGRNKKNADFKSAFLRVLPNMVLPVTMLPMTWHLAPFPVLPFQELS